APQPMDRPDPAPTAATMSRSRSIARLCEGGGGACSVTGSLRTQAGHVNDMRGQEPDLHLVLANDVTHDQIVSPVVASRCREPGHRARFLQDDLVGVDRKSV